MKCPFKPTKQMLLEEKIAGILARRVRAKKTICYEDLGKAVGLLPRHRTIARALGNLAWEDVRDGKPIRASIVVRKVQKTSTGRDAVVAGIPGPGFFSFMREVGYDIPETNEAKKEFIEQCHAEIIGR